MTEPNNNPGADESSSISLEGGKGDGQGNVDSEPIDKPTLAGGDTVGAVNPNDSSAGSKRLGFPEDEALSQKKIKTEGDADGDPASEENKPDDLQPLGASAPPQSQGQPQDLSTPVPVPVPAGMGNVNNANINVDQTKQPAPEEQSAPPPSGATQQVPSTPNNQPIGGGGGGGAHQHPPLQQAQHQMGYPPGNMMGGMMHGQYPPGMMQGYPPYSHHPHQYPGQAMMMAPQHNAPGQPHSTPQGSHAPNPSGGQQPQQQQQQHQQQQQQQQHQQHSVPPQQQSQPLPMGYYGQQPPGPSNDGNQPGSPAGPQAANNNSRPPLPGQYPGMMPNPMHMHMMPQYGPPGMFFGHYPMPGATMMSPIMAHTFNSNNPNSQGGKPSMPAASHHHIQAPPPRRAGIALALSCDDEQLSEYQMLVRKQLEIFEALPEDVESNTQGRKKQVALGQVGIRCRHCSGLPLRQRGRGAVYYPARLQGVYQAAQNMASSHLCESCQCIPPQLKQELRSLRDRRDTASGGKQYWADGARAMGLVETDEGLRLRRPEGANAQSPSS